MIYSDNMRARAYFRSSCEFSKMLCSFEMGCGFCRFFCVFLIASGYLEWT
ncbi:TPA: hypothetical protein SBD05_001631 [Campylobacter jejuni]|nr:hypothetical protein [Campylobacter jejuni]KAJ9778405.1 hypothetical protein QR364_08080 [Campylobacter jejuni]KAK0034664.1 hypothetical protein QR538_07625 [Campylobacter jejuni]HBD9141573.1 hypothetical protein [Campylobacter jejuni]HEF6186902.1 hypothetical protein [Campylobacter jejuni]HEF7072501.1 hypothetical protein [Campylobacter jejuni]